MTSDLKLNLDNIPGSTYAVTELATGCFIMATDTIHDCWVKLEDGEHSPLHKRHGWTIIVLRWMHVGL